MGRIKTWMSSIFGSKPTRKIRVSLTREEVVEVEKSIQNYNRGTIMQWHSISKSTYYNIKRGSHKYSTKSK